MHEKNQIRPYNDGMGIIRLQHVADPTSIKVHVGEEEITPVDFDMFGSPIFNQFQMEHIDFLEKEFQRDRQSIFFRLEAKIDYEVMHFDFDRNSIDTVKGITKYLKSMDGLITLLERRAMYVKEYGKIGSWIIFGRYWLTPEGRLFFVTSREHADLFPTFNQVEQGEHYFEVMHGDTAFSNASLPKLVKCPYCGKDLTIDDVKNYRLEQFKENVIFHSKCLAKYRKEKRLAALLEIMDSAYKNRYTYKQIDDNPYPYFHRTVVAIKCYTPDGVIILSENEFSTRLIFSTDFPNFDINEATKNRDVYVAEAERRIGSPDQKKISAILQSIKATVARTVENSDK
jgi:hypothetical protein